MTHEEYKQQLTAWAGLTEKRLAALCDEYLPQQSELGQAARYSLLGGGKRVRAVLTLATCQLAGADAADALDYACALEMLHCYSLIHDDMPCMDNDDFRRGRPSCHKQFGEATALLAADALVTAAFEVLAHAKCSAESRIEAVQLLARGGGDRGMLYGQELDKHFETVRAGEAELLNLHAHKTGALIIAAVELGCAAAGVRPDTDTRKALVRYAAELGLVFQIVDDILDVTSTTEELGKPVGSDADNDKTTFITLYGLQGAHEEAERHNAAALAALGLPHSSHTPHKDLWYLQRRYFAYPHQSYDVWAVQEAGALLAYAITRTITAAETGCVPVVRLVDFIGDDAVLPRIGGALDKLLHDAGAEYLDCYNAGIPAAVWAAAGLTERREDDGVIIPNYLTPPLRQNTEYYYFTNQPDGFVLFKADGDQDRPNLPCD